MEEYYELVGGIVLLTMAIILGLREIKIWVGISEDDSIRQSFSIQKFAGIIVFLVVGLTLIYGYFS